MPQAGAGSWRSHGIISLYGKGSLHTDLLEATFRARHRADKRNHCEGRHQRLLTKFLDRRQKAENTSMEKALARTRRAVEEKEALREVLQSFTGDKLQTMRLGYRPELVTPTPENIQRCRMERRVLQRGFSVGTLYPEVLKALQERRLDKKPRRFEDTSLGGAGRSYFDTDRRTTDEAMRNERRPVVEVQHHQLNVWPLQNDSTSDQPCGSRITQPKRFAGIGSTRLPPIRKDNDSIDSETIVESNSDQKLQTTEERNFVPQFIARKPLPPIAKEPEVIVRTETRDDEQLIHAADEQIHAADEQINVADEQIADETSRQSEFISRNSTVLSQSPGSHSAAKYSKSVTLR